MVFKSHLQLSIPVFVQNVIEFGETEIKLLAALTSIWKTLSSIDQYIQSSFHDTQKSRIFCVLFRPRTSCQNPRKKAMNDQYIELLQIWWFTADTKIRLWLRHNQTIASLLKDPNPIYILDNYEADLTKDKMQSTETAIAVWLEGPILEQATLEAIEQTLLESNEFQRYDIDQVELLTKRIILKPGK